MPDPLQLSDLRSAVGFLTQDTATDSVTIANIDRSINNAYIWLAGIRGYWRKRSTTITLTSGTVAYDAPSDFSDIYRLYYRRNGLFYEVEVFGDAAWLEVSATASSDAGDPRYARLTQTTTTLNRIELSPPPSSSFITNVGSTLTLEYFIEITRLSVASDEPILPANLRHQIVYPAAYEYALAQGDSNLALQLKVKSEEARSIVLRHDLTRTGKARQLRPVAGYYPDAQRVGYDYM